MTIGVLALQGDFSLQQKVLDNLGQKTIPVKYPDELKRCDGLIIPGGESTTMTMQMQSMGLFDGIRAFAQDHPMMGTCAGAIMLASVVKDARVTPLEVMDIECQRNSWGRQVFSFQSDVSLSFDAETPFHATFIRAPKITPLNNNVEILAQINGKPILVKDKIHLAISFHPEIGTDKRIHEYYLKLF